MKIYYTADLWYKTRAGNDFKGHMEFIDMNDALEFIKSMQEFLMDYDYELLRADINRVKEEQA